MMEKDANTDLAFLPLCKHIHRETLHWVHASLKFSSESLYILVLLLHTFLYKEVGHFSCVDQCTYTLQDKIS